MKKPLKRALCMALGLSLFSTFAGCGEDVSVETKPREIDWAVYDASQDEAMTLAVENYSNFILQNALFYLQ